MLGDGDGIFILVLFGGIVHEDINLTKHFEHAVGQVFAHLGQFHVGLDDNRLRAFGLDDTPRCLSIVLFNQIDLAISVPSRA
jgi:hypothetical protein